MKLFQRLISTLKIHGLEPKRSGDSRRQPHATFFLIAACAIALDSRAAEPVIATDTEFPPRDGGATYIAGELTFVDHVNRVGTLRPDRTDSQPKAFQDLPLHFVMLPYGSIRYHGAQAELRDIPIGTHLHGWFYLGPDGLQEAKPPGYPRKPKQSDKSSFNRVFSFEDDFSFYQGQGAAWKIRSIDKEQQTLSAERVNRVRSETQQGMVRGLTGLQTFPFDSATRVWKGRQIATLDDDYLKPGQEVQLNLTWATLFGPGRCIDIWLDEESREVAAEVQRQRHIKFHHRRGVAARVDHVEHEEAEGRGNAGGTITMTIYGGVDQELIDSFKEKSSLTIYTAEPSLRSYEGDGKIAAKTEIIRTKNPPPGSSGVQLRVYAYELLEGFRPGRTVRLYASGWKEQVKPREERLWPLDVRPFERNPKKKDGGKEGE